jgi:hypothetical protein
MNRPTPDHLPAVYELTIAGAIGPVLRSALAPCRATTTQTSTRLRTSARSHSDVVDLVLRLHEQGLVVEEIVETVATSSSVHDASTGRAAQRGSDKASRPLPGGQT